MALHIRYAYTPGYSLGYSIERLADGLYYDFANGTFNAAPATLVNALASMTGSLVGLYRDNIAATPQAQFANGEYSIHFHNTAAGNVVVGLLAATMVNGDSAPAVSGGGDPWATPLPGSYAAGTAGAIVGTNLDTNVGSRSTYAGGAVASVTAPVTVGTVNDKLGYSLSTTDHAGIAIDVAMGLFESGLFGDEGGAPRFPRRADLDPPRDGRIRRPADRLAGRRGRLGGAQGRARHARHVRDPARRRDLQPLDLRRGCGRQRRGPRHRRHGQ